MSIRLGIVVFCACVMCAFAPSVQPHESEIEEAPRIEIPDLDSMILCRVDRVVDGDTLMIEIDDETVRFELLAINAPEYVERDPTPRTHSREAWFALHSLLESEWVYLHTDPLVKRDAAGRLTGFVFRSHDMMLVNQEMIRQGHAEHQPKRSALYNESLAWWQRHAMDAEKGIWSDDPLVLVEPRTEPMNPAPRVVPAPIEVLPTKLAPDPKERTVFLTKSGSKYHTKECRYYSSSCTEVPISIARKEHEACKVCKPDEADG